MKKNNIAILFLLVLIAFAGCNKDKEHASRQPKVTNEEVTTTSNSATISWMVDFPGSIHTGIEIGLTEDLVDARIIEASNHNAVYSVSIDSLMPMTNYYYRQVVWNSYKRYEFDTQNFTTKAGLPIVETLEVTEITRTTAVCGGKIISNSGAEIIECGICWATVPNPTIDADHIVAEDGQDIFTLEMSELMPEIRYYVRAYAKNSVGFVYGNEVSFVTGDAVLPSVTTLDVADITWTTAKGGGNVTDDGDAEITERGICWSTSHNPTTNESHANSGTGTGSFTVNMTGLTANTTYYVRAYAINSAGTSYGSEVSFTTAQIPTYTISVSANPTNGGTVSGSGTYQHGQSCTVHATANSGYTFLNWTEGDSVVSTQANYTFTVNGNKSLVANFTQGAINGKFTINANGDQVCFSQGNLQYKASTNKWRFAINQYDYIGLANGNISQTYNGWIDLFGWGTSGYNHGAVCYQPWSTSQTYSDYYAYGQYNNNLYDQTGQADWGYNAISNGGNTTNTWRTLTGGDDGEWKYIFDTRSTPSGIRFAKAQVNGVNGVILLPDDWSASYYSLSNTNQGGASYSSNVISSTQWSTLELHGAVFLPAAGVGGDGSLAPVNYVGIHGNYWSASYDTDNHACLVSFSDSNLYPQGSFHRYFRYSVRLVRSAQ